MSRMKQIVWVSMLVMTGLSSALGSLVIMGSDKNQDGNSGTAVNTISSFEVAAGGNRKLVVAINSETVSTLDSITYGGQSFTKAVDTGTSRLSQIWYLDNPTVGTSDIVATWSGNTRSYMGVVSLTGAAAGGPTVSGTDTSWVDAGTTNQASINLTTPEANMFVMAAYTQNAGKGFPADSTLIDLYRGDSGSSASDAGYLIEPSAGLHTYTWTAPDGQEIHTSNGVAIGGFAAVPEPATLGMLGFGTLAIIFVRRWRR